MNAFESRDLVDLDVDAFLASTDRPRVLFITNNVLGWRTFGDELTRATQDRTDVTAVHLRLSADRRPHSGRVGGWRLGLKRRHSHGQIVRAWAGELEAMLRDRDIARSFDAIHVSPHLLALGVIRSGFDRPISILFDSNVLAAKMQRQSMTRSEVERRFDTLLRDEAMIVRRTDRLWSMSQWAAGEVATEYGLDPASISVVPPVRTVVPRSWDECAPSGPVRIAFVGNDLMRKGGYRLLEWHQQRWVGRAELHVFTVERRPKERLAGVVWHERVPNQLLVSEHLKTMDMMVMPTASDMSPFAITEAVAGGLPVVSSSIGGIGELVEHGVTGFLLEPADDRGFICAIERLFDPATRRAMGRASLDVARSRLDVHTVLNRFIDGVVELAQ